MVLAGDAPGRHRNGARCMDIHVRTGALAVGAASGAAAAVCCSLVQGLYGVVCAVTRTSLFSRSADQGPVWPNWYAVVVAVPAVVAVAAGSRDFSCPPGPPCSPLPPAAARCRAASL
ncbi:hypothetical protein GCM10010381_61110 [Streptomyces xantholiticus]|nr:hypothetical protein GCM10010381_61110 [Streptomyces xantholiticus]